MGLRQWFEQAGAISDAGFEIRMLLRVLEVTYNELEKKIHDGKKQQKIDRWAALDPRERALCQLEDSRVVEVDLNRPRRSPERV